MFSVDDLIKDQREVASLHRPGICKKNNKYLPVDVTKGSNLAASYRAGERERSGSQKKSNAVKLRS